MDEHKGSRLIQSTHKALRAAASLAASVMLARTLINEFLPDEAIRLLFYAAESLTSFFSHQHTIIIQEREGYSPNKVYEAVQLYLGSKVSPSMRRLRVSKKSDEQKSITLSPENCYQMFDVFNNIPFKWKMLSKGRRLHDWITDDDDSDDDDDTAELQCFELAFHQRHKEFVLTTYLPYILDRARVIRAQERALKLYINNGDSWDALKLQHPATFSTLAMEPELKQTVMADLASFVRRRDYYRRIGRAWKRGYLLYGPPGTGKSSLVAAMANFLNFDIYALELSAVGRNKTLQRLLVGMENKAILLVEDIDCSIELSNRYSSGCGESEGRSEKLTLSGLLNAVDGLWSTCGEERIIIFTTNYKDRLDPALLRPGRMDMHIHMGYCGVQAFRMLAANYHGIEEHELFEEIEELIEEVNVTPAEVAERLMRSDDATAALLLLIEFIECKRGMAHFKEE